MQLVPRVDSGALGSGVRLACIVDVETTGLNPNRDEIIELSMLLFAFSPETGEVLGVVDEYTGQREPGVSISREATAVHGLTKRKLKGLQLDQGRINRIITRTELFIAHNASFDAGFCIRLMPQFNNRPWVCSMRGVPWKQIGHTSQGLQKLLRDHRIAVDTAHRAGADTEALLHLLNHQSHRGRTYLHQVVNSRPLSVVDKREVAASRQAESQASSVHTPQGSSKAGCAGVATVVLTVVVWGTVHWFLGLLVLIGGLVVVSRLGDSRY